MSEKQNSNAASNLYAIPVPVIMTAHIRADSEEQAIQIAREHMENMSFDLRDGMEINGVPVNASHQTATLPDISLSAHVFASDVRHIEFGQDISDQPLIQPPEKNPGQYQIPLTYGSPKKPESKVWGAIYCVGDKADIEDNIPCIAPTEAECYSLIANVLKNLSVDHQMNTPPEFDASRQLLNRSIANKEPLPDAAMATIWDNMERQASILRYNEVDFSILGKPRGDVPVLKSEKASGNLLAGMVLDETGQFKIAGVGNDHHSVNAASGIVSKENAQNYRTIPAYTLGSLERVILDKASILPPQKNPTPASPQPSLGL